MPETAPSGIVVDASVARHILQRVGEYGQPPEIGIEHLNVGTESLLRILDEEYLDPIAEHGRGSAFKLVQSYFGGGKTHFQQCVRQRAWARGMCAAMVGLSPQECPFDDPLRIYQAVARELTWPPVDLTALPSRGVEHTLRIALDERRDAMGDEALLDWLRTDFRRVPVDAPSYRAAVVAFAGAYIRSDYDAEELAAAWLRGEVVPAGEAATLGVRETVRKDNGFRMLRSLCQVLQGLGGRGLLLCFDELDRNLSLPPRRRRAVADNLRELIDLCGREALPGLLCMYAVPPEFMRHVVTEYPALQQRLEGPRSLSRRSPQAAVIDLEELDRSDEELLVGIGHKLLALFEIARGMQLDTDAQGQNLRALAREVLEGSFEVAHRRAFVKAAVDLLHGQADGEHALTVEDLRTLAGRGGEVIPLHGDAAFEEF